ncbi:MAG: ABC transporter substrate-binding protein [Treponema sp.]|nr:ABC transporter substrate-binding protein [Treponema sp.]
MKRVILLTIVFMLAFMPTVSGLFAQSGRLTVWSFTDELENMINNYYKRSFPNVRINYSLTPTEQFEARLDPVLASGRGAPDVFALESAFVRKYVESGMLMDISPIYERNRGKLLQYTVDIGTHNDRVYALSWQACPGGMFYRRSLARRYLGTDDPAVVQTRFRDLETFFETAQDLKNRSNGRCVVVSSIGDLYNVFLSARSTPWVVNGRLNIDPSMERYMDIAKSLRDNRYEGRVGQWSEGWFAGMNDNLRDENGNRLEVFAYFLPTWGLHYVLKTNAPNTAGDWAMIPDPSSYRWGGTWIGAYRRAANSAQAMHMIEWLTTNEGFLEAWARDTGDIVSSIPVMNRIKNNFSERFLGGQNHYAMFAEMAMNVDGRLTQGTDGAIETFFNEALLEYVDGNKSKAQALADFRNAVTRGLNLR